MTSRSIASVAFLVLTFPLLAVAVQNPPPQPIKEGFGEGAYRTQAGITLPIVLRRVEPRYTTDAMQAKIQGEVELELIVLSDGTIGAVQVVRSLDKTYGLDEEAVKAARQWLFRPGSFNGKPVPVVVRLVLEFKTNSPYAPSQPPPAPQTPYWIPDAEFLRGTAWLGQPNVTMPVLVQPVAPKYTADAMRAKLMGTVTVDMVIGPDGNVLRSRISRSLDPNLGLDRTAIEAASQWRFSPGLVNGQPANVLVTVTMEFRLH
jgi:TonB family protein